MKTGTTLLAILITATSMGACLDLGDNSMDAPQPKWSSGYVYSFIDHGRDVVKASGSGPDGGITRNTDEKTGPFLVVYEVLNTTMRGDQKEPAYLIAFTRVRDGETAEDKTVRVEAGGQEFEFEDRSSNVRLHAARQRDLHEMDVDFALEQGCSNTVCRSELRNVHIDSGPAWTFLDFPLKAGQTWTASVEQDVDDFDDVRMRVSAEVEGRARAATPLGDLNTVRVTFDYKAEGLDEVKDNIRRDAERDGVQIRDLDMDFRRRVVVYYSPVYQNVVRMDQTFDQSYRISGTEDGQDFSFAYELRSEFHRELTGAKLVSHPERDLDGIGRILVGDKPLVDPRGQSFRPGGYSVTIDGDAKSVNVAQGQAADYKAVLKGVQSLPDGHTLEWRVTDAAGRAVETGMQGPTFSFKPAEPGLYVIEVETHDASGNLTSAAATALAANFIGSKDAPCSQVVASPAVNNACQSWQIPVRPGVRSLDVVAKISGPLIQAEAGELRVRDAAGVVVRDQTRSGDEYSVSFGRDRPFNIKGVSSHDWTIEYAPSRSAMSGVHYDVKMMYEDEPAVRPPRASSMDAFARLPDTWSGQAGVVGLAS